MQEVRRLSCINSGETPDKSLMFLPLDLMQVYDGKVLISTWVFKFKQR